MSILIGRFIEEICLNPLEYVHDDDGNLLEFDSKDQAKDFIKTKIPEISEDSLEDIFVYEDKVTGERN